MKKKIMVFGAIIILLTMILAPCSGAILLKEKKIEPACLGSIYGNAGTSHGWGFTGVFFAKITAGGRTTISLPFDGQYRIKYLPLGTYTITGTKRGYDTFTDRVTLTKDRPDKQVFVHLEPNDKSINKAKTPETIEKIENDDNTGKYGRVSGMVHTAGFPPYTEISGAMLVLKGDSIKRITFSGFLGFYGFNFLTIGRTYTITASHPKYKTQTETFTINADKPHIFLNFAMYEKNTRNIESEEPAGLGSIWGNTGEKFDTWGFSPVGLVKVEAGGKTTYSSPILGCYKIRNLPLGTYTITGTKRGYDTFTDTVKLTEEYPDKQVIVHMEPNDESVNRAKPGISNLITEKISESLAKAGFGIVLGSTMWQKNWGMGDLPYVEVEAIGQGLPRVKNSGPFARFSFILPLDRTYTIYGYKTGYDSDSETVTLTSEKPLQFVDLVLKAHNKNVETREKIGLFASTKICSNARSYFFSTFTFVS